MRGGDGRDRLAHHPARRRVDRGLADGDGEPGPGHRPDPRPRPELDTRTGGTLAHRGVDERKVGHVRVVARVLDDSGAGVPRPQLLRRERERGPAPPRQLDGDRVREPARHERGIRGPGRGGGARAGRPAAAQAFSLGRRHPAILAATPRGLFARLTRARRCSARKRGPPADEIGVRVRLRSSRSFTGFVPSNPKSHSEPVFAHADTRRTGLAHQTD